MLSGTRENNCRAGTLLHGTRATGRGGGRGVAKSRCVLSWWGVCSTPTLVRCCFCGKRHLHLSSSDTPFRNCISAPCCPRAPFFLLFSLFSSDRNYVCARGEVSAGCHCGRMARAICDGITRMKIGPTGQRQSCMGTASFFPLGPVLCVVRTNFHTFRLISAGPLIGRDKGGRVSDRCAFSRVRAVSTGA